ncbi:hypothetical protein JCM10908_006960 [Rhodotorula pacifica]|uniref:uncharacterized protein n=1 Tax=Rhodotorula pacifica TaxID=1495444 RepID=UPI00317338CA
MASAAGATAAGDKAGVSKIARPASRQSSLGGEPFKPVPPPPGPATRSRIGVQTRAKAASAIPRTNRPSSVLGNRPPSSLSSATAPKSAIPTGPIRRPSVSASQPGGSSANSSAVAPHAAQESRARQLEAELATANETISTLQNALAEAEINASSLSTSLHSTQTEVDHFSNELARCEEELAQARTDAEVAREEVVDLREEHAAEVAALKHQAEDERTTLVERTKDLEERCTAAERERDDLAGSREDLERLLEEARVDSEDYAELEAERDELETELAWHEEELQKVEEARQVDQQTIETLRAELEDADNVIGELEKENERLVASAETLTAKVAELEAAVEAKGKQGSTTEEEERSATAATEADAEKRLSSVRSELSAQISEVEQERDGLIAALAAASKAHREAEDRLERVQRAQAEAAVKTEAQASLTQAALEELATLRHEHDETKSQLVAAVAERDSLAAAATPVVEPAPAELPALDVPAVEITDLRDRIADLEDELASSEKTIDRLEAQLEEVSPPSDAVAGLFGTMANRELEDALYDRDEAERELKLAEDRIAELEAELESAGQSVERVVVDDEAHQRASEAEARCEALQHELEQLQLQQQESQARSTSEEDAKQLTTLRAELEAERTLTADAKRESVAVEEALMDAKSQLIQLESKLASCEARLRDLVAQHEADQARLAQVDELEHALQHAEEQLEAVTYELDDLRAQHEDLAQNALQDAAERQTQSDEHDELLELYNRRALETDSLRKILAETEAHADSLAWQLREKESHASEVEQAHLDERESLLARISHAEEEQDRLRTELDEAKHRLSDAQDALDNQLAAADTSSTSLSLADSTTSRGAPATPSPLSPGNNSFSLSPSTDPVALLLRLREERDELRERLDFARTEAKHRMDDLQDRLRRLEEAKVQDISLLQLDLMDKQAAYETEREMNVKLEQTVREANQRREELSETAENANRRLREAETRVQDLSKELARGQEQLRAAQGGEQRLSQLQTSLADAQQAMETAQAEAAVAQAQLEQLQLLLDSAEEERDAALLLASERAEAIRSLETRVAEHRAEKEATAPTPQDPLVDLASLCEALPAEDVESRTRISGLEATLRQYEQRIALLQLNLAMRVAIEDEDEQDDVSVERDADATFVADANEEILSIRDQLAAASRERDGLFARLQVTLDELDIAVQQREQLAVQNVEMEKELTAVQANAAAQRTDLAVAQADVKELAQRMTTYAEEATAAQLRAVQVEQIADAAQRRMEILERELVDMVQLRTDFEASKQKLESLRAEAEAAKSALATAEQKAQRLANDLAEARQAVQVTRDELATAQATVADLDRRHAHLEQDTAARIEHLTSEVDEARRSGNDRELHLGQAQQRTDDLERDLALVAQQLEAVKQQSEARIADLDHKLAFSAREYETLCRLSESSAAEAEALAAEATGLKYELQQVHTAKQAELKAAHEEATRNLTEVITELEKRERGQLAAEEHARQLAAELEHVRSASQSRSPDDQARITELEKALDARMLDVEAADERLIEALKVQKKSSALVERLKAKIASLQRDLAAAKSASAPVVLAAAPLPDVAATPSAGKKRPAPTEFDAKSVSQPRPIAQAPPRALDKENLLDSGSARKVQRPLSAVKPAALDKSISLAAQAPRRDALALVDENAGAALGRAAEPSTDKIAALNARLQNFRRPKSAEIPLH